MSRYFVLNENTLCYRIEGTEMCGVLGASRIRGGKDWINGPFFLSPLDVVREATLADFEEYRICPKGHIV